MIPRHQGRPRRAGWTVSGCPDAFATHGKHRAVPARQWVRGTADPAAAAISAATACSQLRWLAGAALLALAGAWVAAGPLGLAARPATVAGLLGLLLVAPLLEELLLRPGLQQGMALWLARRGASGPQAGAGAALLATAAFALLHAPAHGVVAAAWLLPGALLAETWRRTGSLAACVGLHGLMNAALWAFSVAVAPGR